MSWQLTQHNNIWICIVLGLWSVSSLADPEYMMNRPNAGHWNEPIASAHTIVLHCRRLENIVTYWIQGAQQGNCWGISVAHWRGDQ